MEFKNAEQKPGFIDSLESVHAHRRFVTEYGNMNNPETAEYAKHLMDLEADFKRSMGKAIIEVLMPARTPGARERLMTSASLGAEAVSRYERMKELSGKVWDLLSRQQQFALVGTGRYNLRFKDRQKPRHSHR